MDWKECVKELRNIKNNNRLVVFVGAGISKNSGMPLWGELINKIALDIGYSKCDMCKHKSGNCQKNCKFSNDYSSEEFLNIPEYFYDSDKSDGKKDYYRYLKDEMYKNAKANSLDDIIVDMLPHHIITTNYDFLLEEANSVNISRYTIVKRDKDLLSDENEHYMIKMHGSLDDMETVVLKESDYIDYENKHPLICTMIKALLLNHSFLFLGYSLNDYNLKLIMGWINYYRKLHDEKEIKHFLFATNEYSEFEKKRLEENNIYVINGENIPQEAVDVAEVPDDLSYEGAKKMYTFLKCINGSDIWLKYSGLKEIIEEIYDLYVSYNKVAFVDLIYVLPFKKVELYCNTLVFYDKENYYAFKKEIENKSKLYNLFIKAHIFSIQLFGEDSDFYEIIVDKCENKKSFDLALMNNYIELYSEIKKGKDIAEQIYYYKILGDKDLPTLLNKTTFPKDFVDYLLIKMRQRITSISFDNSQKKLTDEIREAFQDKQFEYKKCVYQLEDLFSSTSKDRLKMGEILNKTEERYGIGFSGSKTGGAHIELQKMQGYAYNYYYFFKLNYLPLDTYTDPITYFEPYIKAMLCTYYKTLENNYIFFQTRREEYCLSEIDFDIITKYTIPLSLLEYIKQYSAKHIKLNDEIKATIYVRFNNLCEAFLKFKTEIFCRYIYSTVILLQNSEGIDLEKICESVFRVLRNIKIKSLFGNDFVEILNYIISNNKLNRTIKNSILKFFLKEEVFLTCYNSGSHRKYENIIRLLSDSIGYYKSKSLFKEISSKNDFFKMYFFRKLLPKKSVNLFFEEHIEEYDVYQISRMLFENRIEFSNDIQSIFIRSIEKKWKDRKGSIQVIPDGFKEEINYFLLLDLINIDVDLSLIWKYRNESDFIDFVYDPDSFDYSKVNVQDYMWQNYMYSEKYKNYFIKNKESIIDDNLKAQFLSNRADMDLQKIVYGILLDDNELHEFPLR